MAAKIGILGEGTSVSIGDTTVYTVPADKASRVSILFLVEGPASGGRFAVRIGSPGTEKTINLGNIAAGNDTWSGYRPEATPDPVTSMLANVTGVQRENAGLGNLDGVAEDAKDWVGTPLPGNYFLSTGDTVKYDIEGNAASDVLVQVFGVEDDA